MLGPGRIATERYLAANQRRAEKSGLSLEEVDARARRSIPLGRIGDPQEIADAVAFIVSERGRYCSGSNEKGMSPIMFTRAIVPAERSRFYVDVGVEINPNDY